MTLEKVGAPLIVVINIPLDMDGRRSGLSWTYSALSASFKAAEEAGWGPELEVHQDFLFIGWRSSGRDRRILVNENKATGIATCVLHVLT